MQPLELNDFHAFKKAELIVGYPDDLALKFERVLNRTEIIVGNKRLPPVQVSYNALRFGVT